jgi:NAD-dependent DNA ligase
MALNLRRGLSKDDQIQHDKEMNQKPVVVDEEINLNNCVFCITGTIQGMTRDQAVKKILEKFPSARFSPSMSSDVEYLITGTGCGQTKLRVAARRGSTLIEANSILR